MGALININLHSKKHLANQISSKLLPPNSARDLIDFVIKNHNRLWKDNLKESQPEKGKWVRSAFGTKLGKLLKLIDQRVLTPQDKNLPSFIFGGRKGVSNVKAAKHLLGYQKERTLLAVDIKSFFENVSISKVERFYKNNGCSPRIATILSKLSCVRRGSKSNPENDFSIARGFSTSTRLAVWSNIVTFYKIHDLVMKKLKDHDPRITFFIDDIGISASRVPDETMWALVEDIDKILMADSGGALKLNRSVGKLAVMNYKEGIKHLGVVLTRNKLVLPVDLQSRLDWYRYRYKATRDATIKDKKKGYQSYSQSIRKISKE